MKTNNTTEVKATTLAAAIRTPLNSTSNANSMTVSSSSANEITKTATEDYQSEDLAFADPDNDVLIIVSNVPDDASLVNELGEDAGYRAPNDLWYLNKAEVTGESVVYFKPAPNFNGSNVLGVHYSDDFVDDNLTVTVAAVNDLPTGSVSIANIGLVSDPADDLVDKTLAAVSEYQTLHAEHNLYDVDNMSSGGADITVTYQWLRSASPVTAGFVGNADSLSSYETIAGGEGTDGADYQLSQTDVIADKKYISVVAIYTDAGGTTEYVFSPSTTAAVVDVIDNTAPSIVSSTGSLSLFENDLIGVAQPVMSSGTLVVSDVDSGDSIVSDVDVQVISTSEHTANSRFGSWNDADLLAMLDVIKASDTALNWTFNSGSTVFNELHFGESIILNYGIKVADSHGASSNECTLAVVITGIDEAMTVSPHLPNVLIPVGNTTTWTYDANNTFHDDEVTATEHQPIVFGISEIKKDGVTASPSWLNVSNDEATRGVITIDAAIPAGSEGDYSAKITATSTDRSQFNDLQTGTTADDTFHFHVISQDKWKGSPGMGTELYYSANNGADLETIKGKSAAEGGDGHATAS